MCIPVFTIKLRKASFKFTAACLLIFTIAGSVNLFAQYKGAPVKKDRLIKALRSKQLQTRDIVTIINSNGVDFQLTPALRKALIAAGARPEVIKAVSDNQRLSSGEFTARRRNKPVTTPPSAPDYDELLDRAIYSYKNQQNPQGAVRILEAAVKMKPKNPAAYQMLGFIYLYELKNPAQAEKSMRESFLNGGSAVFRVFHDDNGKFTDRCTGSLYISQDNLRFESDDNVHTFETSVANVDKIKLDTESTRVWKKYSIFKIFLKIGDAKTKFRFAPLNGAQNESEMVARFISASAAEKNSTISSLKSFSY